VLLKLVCFCSAVCLAANLQETTSLLLGTTPPAKARGRALAIQKRAEPQRHRDPCLRDGPAGREPDHRSQGAFRVRTGSTGRSRLDGAWHQVQERL